MSLSDFASLGSFASGVAVLISLIYLSAQVRQATKHQQAQMLESRTTRVVDYQMQLAEPGLAPVWDKLLRGAHDLTELEITQMVSILRANLIHAEATYLQHEQRLMSDRAFESMRKNWVAVLSFPGARVIWRRFHGGFDPGFAVWMDDQLARATNYQPLSAAKFNSDIATEIAAMAPTA
jgi:hypothetical protein